MGTSAGKSKETKEKLAVPPGPSSSGTAKEDAIEEESNGLSAIPRFAVDAIPGKPPYDALIDSGSQGTLISVDVVSRDKLTTKPLDEPVCLVTATGGREFLNEVVELDPYGTGKVLAKVAPLKANTELILGYDWLTRVNATYDFSKERLTFTCKDGTRKTIWKKATKRYGSIEECNTILMSKKQLRKAAKRDEVEDIFLIEFKRDVDLLKLLEENDVYAIVESIADVRLKQIVANNPDVYAKEPKITGLPKDKMELSHPTMLIDTGDAKPIKSQYYQLGAEDLQELKRQLKILVESKLIRPSSSPWGSPVLFVKKKDGSKRMVIDYRRLNRLTKSDAYPLPRIQDNLDRLGKAKVFSIMDATSGFHQNRMHPDDIEKTAFVTRYGSYEFLVTPFGLKNSPSAFQRMMNEVLGDLLDTICVCYMDDLVVYSENMDEHVLHLEMVTKRLKKFGIQINMKKSHFGVSEIVYCGFKIVNGTTTVDPSKIALMTEWPTPRNVSDVRSFLGFVGYYRRYIRDFASIAAPLTDLTKANVSWKWSYIHQKAFNQLKQAMVHSPVLYAPDEGKEFIVTVDAGPRAVGGVLEQAYDDGLHAVAYAYHRLSEREERYSQYEKEFLGLLHCLRKWKHYLQGRKFKVFSDNKSLVQFMQTHRDPHHRVARWLEEFELWSPDIQHIEGKSNKADGPSRIDIDYLNTPPISDYEVDYGLEVNLLVQTDVMDLQIDEEQDWPIIVAHYLWNNNTWPFGVSDAIKSKCIGQVNKFKLMDGKLVYLDPLTKVPSHYVPFNDRAETILRFHDGLGHLKYDSIITLLKRRFWWPGMDEMVREYIKGCPRCQLDASANNFKYRAPIKPIPAVAIPFERWGIDAVGPLPETKAGNRHIITAIDYATRWVVAKAVKSVDAVTVAKFLYEDILMNYGSPFELISDRGNAFLADSVDLFEKTQKIKHLATSSYHPQTNGMVERMHAMLGHALTTLVDGATERWDEFLPQTLFALRVRTHAVTKYSPFYLLYGVEPRLPGDAAPPREAMLPLDDIEKLEEKGEFHARTFEALGYDRAAAYKRTQVQAEAMKKRYNLDENAPEYYFKIGDWVKMKNHQKNKLDYDWKGPYMIAEIGFPGTYWIMAPDGTRWPNVVNQVELAPWLATTKANQSYFYDGKRVTFAPDV